MSKSISRLVFDFETEQFNDLFRYATSPQERIRHAPKLRVACVLNMVSGSYSYYLPGTADKLIARLLKADQIISYNGKGFDMLVLQRHHRLSKKAAALINSHHIDLCQEVERLAGRRCKLDELARLNLNEKKHTDGRQMSSLNMSALRLACQSDVSQTHRIFLKWKDGSLQLPPPKWRNSGSGDIPLIHLHLPNPFPYAYIDQDTEDMTEGQLAEYLAGTWGVRSDGTLVEM
jgi:hypothetical protein